jgi:hypothetical protein
MKAGMKNRIVDVPTVQDPSVLPSKDPSLTFVWQDISTNLKSQLDRKGDGWGAGHTLVFPHC